VLKETVMAEKDKDPGKGLKRFVRRIVDGVEDAAEDVVRKADKIEDAVEDKVKGKTDGDHDAYKLPGNVVLKIDVHCCCCPGGTHQPGGTGPGGTGQPPPGTRPPHKTGTSDGSLPGGITGIGGVIGIVTRPPDVWPGPRTQLFLPLLFLRANPGDLGARPVTGVFWESPDILIAPGVAPASAPNVPDHLGGIAEANKDNTLYAHVWNLGQAPCPDTLVEFYWFNPSIGFGGDKANFIGATWVNLRGRSDSGSHKLVKCPISWRAQFLNGGHECLVVRVSQPALDPLSAPEWDSSRNRHVGQRNIHVMSAAEAAAKPTLPIAVGPLFGGAAQVAVARNATTTMPWLHLVTMNRNAVPGTGAATGDVGLTPPTPAGTPLPNLGAVPNARGAGLIGDQHGVAGDDKQVGFHATDGHPGAGNAHVYRVTGTQNGAVFGGYTVVVVG
jgi:hypothetical protein